MERADRARLSGRSAHSCQIAHNLERCVRTAAAPQRAVRTDECCVSDSLRVDRHRKIVLDNERARERSAWAREQRIHQRRRQLLRAILPSKTNQTPWAEEKESRLTAYIWIEYAEYDRLRQPDAKCATAGNCARLLLGAPCLATGCFSAHSCLRSVGAAETFRLSTASYSMTSSVGNDFAPWPFSSR